MAFVPPHDRVLEHSTSSSQPVFAVTGAVDTSYNAFSASMSIGDTTIGGVVEPGVAFVSGVLTYSAANQVTVTTVMESKGTFSAGGVKQVFMGLPAQMVRPRQIVIYADGQSNISRTVTFAWSPNPNVRIWNNPQGATGLGTAFTTLSATTIGSSEKFASDIADANPTSTVYLIKNGQSGQAIAQWLSGASAPDMYANGIANVAAALAVIGATKIDIYFRWQGEQDAAVFNPSYVANFATMMTRYWSNSWFPQETPCVIMAVASTAITSVAASDYINNFLRAIVSADPDKRRFVYTPSLSGSTYWDVALTGHGTGQGYFSFDAMAANDFLRGTSRLPTVDPVTGGITAGNPLFTTAPFGASANVTATITAPVGGTLFHGVGIDGGPAYVLLDNFNGAGNELLGRHAGGTATVLAATPADKLLVGMASFTYNGAAYTPVNGAFQIYSNGPQSLTNYGSYALLYLTPLNSTTVQQAVRWDIGGITINGATSGGLKLAVPAVAGSNTLTFPAGTTDFTATGGASKFIKQATAGGALTVVQPVLADVSGLLAGLRGYIAGLILSTAGSSATFSVAAGTAVDSTQADVMSLSSAISKTTSAWAVGSGNGGIDTGAVANSTWYHVYLIKRPDTGVVDVLFSLSASSPTLPTNYTLFRRIGSMKTNGSAQWTAFTQTGEHFAWNTPVADASNFALTSTAANFTLTLPTGIIVLADIQADWTNATTANITALIYNLAIGTQVAGTPAGNWSVNCAVATVYTTNALQVETNTSAQVAAVSGAGGGANSLYIITRGWFDRRGRDA